MTKWTPPFETTDSVIEILWDVALAFFVVRLALLYAGLTLGTAHAVAFLVRHASFSCVDGNLLPLVTVGLSALWTAILMWWCEVPRVLAFRFAVGLTAAAVVYVVEMVGAVVEYEVYGSFGLGGVFGPDGKTGFWVQSLILVMPMLLMPFGKRRPGEGAALGFVGEKRGETSSVGMSEKRREVGGL